MLSIAAAALLTFAGRGLADIVNFEYAAWPARGKQEDLLRYVTVPMCAGLQFAGTTQLMLQRSDPTLHLPNSKLTTTTGIDAPQATSLSHHMIAYNAVTNLQPHTSPSKSVRTFTIKTA